MREFIRKTMLAGAVIGLMSLGAAAQSSDKAAGSSQDSSKSASSASGSSQLSAADQTFVKKAAQGGMAEVELGKLATQKASSEEVKKFGQRMSSHHHDDGVGSTALHLVQRLDATNSGQLQIQKHNIGAMVEWRRFSCTGETCLEKFSWVTW